MKPRHISKAIDDTQGSPVATTREAYTKHFIRRARERFALELLPADVDRLNRIVRNRLGQRFDPWVVPLGQVSRQSGTGAWVKRIGLLLWIESSYYVCVYDLKAESLVTVLPSASIRLAEDRLQGGSNVDADS